MGGLEFTDETLEVIRSSYGRLKRNGKTTAFCSYCGDEIKGVAYIVQARDVARLLIEPMPCTSRIESHDSTTEVVGLLALRVAHELDPEGAP